MSNISFFKLFKSVCYLLYSLTDNLIKKKIMYWLVNYFAVVWFTIVKVIFPWMLDNEHLFLNILIQYWKSLIKQQEDSFHSLGHDWDKICFIHYLFWSIWWFERVHYNLRVFLAVSREHLMKSGKLMIENIWLIEY